MNEQEMIDFKNLDISIHYNKVLNRLAVSDIQVLHAIEEIGEVLEAYLDLNHGLMLIEIVDLYGIYMLIAARDYSQFGKINPLLVPRENFELGMIRLEHSLLAYIRKRERYATNYRDMITYLRSAIGMCLSTLCDIWNLDYYRLQNLVRNMSLLQFVARPLSKAPNDTGFTVDVYNIYRDKVENIVHSFSKAWQNVFNDILKEEKFLVKL
jgi:hypothetical protein